MPKLYFRYGAMGAAKTLNLLAVAHNYEDQGKRVLVCKPGTDTRTGTATIRSRAGLGRDADIVIHTAADLRFDDVYSCVLIDEAQFLDPDTVMRLREIADTTPVICYGLRTDFRGKLFPGSAALFELADTIEEIKTTCCACERKATHTVRFVDGIPTLEGPQVHVGDEEYEPVCWTHWRMSSRMADPEYRAAMNMAWTEMCGPTGVIDAP